MAQHNPIWNAIFPNAFFIILHQQIFVTAC